MGSERFSAHVVTTHGEVNHEGVVNAGVNEAGALYVQLEINTTKFYAAGFWQTINLVVQ